MSAVFLRKIIKQEVSIPVTGVDLSDLFWAMGDEEQAIFFNELGAKERLCFQLQSLTDCDTLDISGRIAMQRIGEYASKI